MRTRGISGLLLAIPSLVGAAEYVSAEKAMGGADNLRTVLAAEVVSFEKVTVPPLTRITGFEGGHVKTEELTVNNWEWGLRLSIEKGPIAVPASIALRLRKCLMSTDVIPEMRLGSRYFPTYRFGLKEAGHVLEIFVMETTGYFDVYRDGVRLGSHSGDMRIIADLEIMLQRSRMELRQPPEPTPSARGSS